ncbi:amidohydrolase family protein [Glaciihabitans sp. UYNi722]|uniref:amidohydrolase family protein n=1 Tax=Glaciihabitans sp. UYNi722 TaxID=3156344 RepID=UPI00339946AC
MKLIGLEEHVVTADVLAAWQALEPQWQDLALAPSSVGDNARRLAEVGPERIAAMDATGLDVQVLSLSTPGVQNLESGDAVRLQSATNDTIAEAVRRNPDRFQGFATLATSSPADAARELERAITQLGLNGAMVFGRTREKSIDHPDFLPIFETAAALHAPLYLHPQSPLPSVREAYYSGFTPPVEAAFASHRIGWHYDAGVQLLRLILSGVFDRFPELQVVVGHWGEVVMFYLERIDLLSQFANLPRPLSDYLRTNVYVTASGMLSQRYLGWSKEIIGVDRILFSTDYPFEPASRGGARQFLEDADLSPEEKEGIASGNWDRLCSGILR